MSIMASLIILNDQLPVMKTKYLVKMLVMSANFIQPVATLSLLLVTFVTA